ncbi:uncharacterized protein LOC116381831 isoform X2 [Anarrhichthys ocellatus]|uniref:uncharacterized protein LOC116381831 isoform X2 n=1 Tax=Anarrhichthys ocellatus TaxID=433405 RepID=UPI0012ED517B|nr:uncharacterized protein LOC116381831 isoform X2 [Anarrhichthys ocellatus]
MLYYCCYSFIFIPLLSLSADMLLTLHTHVASLEVCFLLCSINWRRSLRPGKLSRPKNLMKVRKLTSTPSRPPSPGTSRPRLPASSPSTKRRSACPSPPPSRNALTATLWGRFGVKSAMEMEQNHAICVTALGGAMSKAALAVMLQAKQGPGGFNAATFSEMQQKSSWCTKCNARGNMDCETCEGKRQMLSYIKLKVKWSNHEEYHVVPQNSGLKIELDSVNGKELFQNSQSLLYPLLGFPNPAISEASQRMIKDHQTKYGQTSRILQQRQTVELIPITKVNYKWKGKAHLYYVYGNEHKVSADNYPATCCCVIQ